jgi:predicted nuclease with TOPRIM domain
MDHEIARLKRKEIIHEKALCEQVENAERRVEYEQLKNRKVVEQIQIEQGKIDKIKDKYKDRQVQLQEKLEEMNKDLKFAQMLMKTYVD